LTYGNVIDGNNTQIYLYGETLLSKSLFHSETAAQKRNGTVLLNYSKALKIVKTSRMNFELITN